MKCVFTPLGGRVGDGVAPQNASRTRDLAVVSPMRYRSTTEAVVFIHNINKVIV